MCHFVQWKRGNRNDAPPITKKEEEPMFSSFANNGKFIDPLTVTKNKQM